MAALLEYNTYEEFEEAIHNHNVEVLEVLIPVLIYAWKNKLSSIHALEIFIILNNEIVDIIIQRRDIPEILQNCFNKLIELEQYELCGEINKILNPKSSF